MSHSYIHKPSWHILQIAGHLHHPLLCCLQNLHHNQGEGLVYLTWRGANQRGGIAQIYRWCEIIYGGQAEFIWDFHRPKRKGKIHG